MDVTTFVLLLAVGLRAALLGVAVWWIIPRRPRCPHCSSATVAIVTPTWLDRLRLERRWCPCGWDGISKPVRSPPPPGDGGRNQRVPPEPAPGHHLPAPTTPDSVAVG